MKTEEQRLAYELNVDASVASWGRACLRAWDRDPFAIQALKRFLHDVETHNTDSDLPPSSGF